MVVPSDPNDSCAVGLPRQLADGVVAGDVVDGQELQGVHLVQNQGLKYLGDWCYPVVSIAFTKRFLLVLSVRVPYHGSAFNVVGLALNSSRPQLNL